MRLLVFVLMFFNEILALQIIWKLYVMKTLNPTAGVGIVAIDCN
jgi:hypothetical protein